jgi:hypothetical protein
MHGHMNVKFNCILYNLKLSQQLNPIELTEASSCVRWLNCLMCLLAPERSAELYLLYATNEHNFKISITQQILICIMVSLHLKSHQA